MDRLGNEMHPMIQMLFTRVQFPKKMMLPFIQLELLSHGLKSMKVNFSIFPGQHNHQISTSLNHSGQFCRLEG
jgi:hypothetical protein